MDFFSTQLFYNNIFMNITLNDAKNSDCFDNNITMLCLFMETSQSSEQQQALTLKTKQYNLS